MFPILGSSSTKSTRFFVSTTNNGNILYAWLLQFKPEGDDNTHFVDQEESYCVFDSGLLIPSLITCIIAFITLSQRFRQTINKQDSFLNGR
jgi:hypothetical protein